MAKEPGSSHPLKTALMWGAKISGRHESKEVMPVSPDYIHKHTNNSVHSSVNSLLNKQDMRSNHSAEPKIVISHDRHRKRKYNVLCCIHSIHYMCTTCV